MWGHNPEDFSQYSTQESTDENENEQNPVRFSHGNRLTTSYNSLCSLREKDGRTIWTIAKGLGHVNKMYISLSLDFILPRPLDFPVLFC